MEDEFEKYSKCPFFNRSFSSTDNALLNSDFDLNHLSKFSDSLSISEFLTQLTIALHLPDQVRENELPKIVKVFEMNWLFTWKHLKMLDPKKLEQLQIPVMLASEIERALVFYREQVESFEGESHARVLDLSQMLFRAEKYDEKDIDNMRSLWKGISEEDVDKFSEIFYTRFFQRSPVGKRLFFSRSLEEQAKTLGRIIGWIEQNLDSRDKLTRYVKRLGGRHTLYGVTANDYYPFIEEIAETLEIHFGRERATPEVKKSWKKIMSYCAKQMLEGSKKYDNGVCFEAMFGDEVGETQASYLKLTLDRLYVCDDNSYSNYKREFVLEGLSGVELIDENSFKLISSNPPFEIVLGSEGDVKAKSLTKSDKRLKSLLKRFTWRIKAIKRVNSGQNDYSGDSHEDSDSVTTLATNANQIMGDHPEESSNESLHIGHKDVLQRTWSLIAGNSDSDAVGDFFEALFKRLLKLSPISVELFGDKPILSHIPMLAKMIGLIIRDPSEQSSKLIARVGAKHFIFGLTPEDMNVFALCVCDALQHILGDLVSQEVRDVWFDTISHLGRLMLREGKKLQNDGTRFETFLRNRKGNWSNTGAILTLSELHIYKGTSFKNFKTSINLRQVFEADVEGNDFFEKPSDYCAVIKMKEVDKSHWFCFSSRIELRTFVSDIQWRMRALQMRNSETEKVNSGKRKKVAMRRKKAKFSTSGSLE